MESFGLLLIKFCIENRGIKIDYNWQPQIFTMPNGKTYRPDLYLPDSDVWIEIKGYFRKDAKIKWDWFHKEHPNSELWNEEKLKEMKILGVTACVI